MGNHSFVNAGSIEAKRGNRAMNVADTTSFYRLIGGSAAIGLTLLTALTMSTVGLAQDAATESPPPSGAPAATKLATTQELIATRYGRFEDTLHQLSDYLRKSDPQRAELLVRAVGKSKSERIHDHLRELTEVLRREQLGDAIEREESVIAQMQVVLELLMSEDRRDEIEKERARVRDLIKDVDKLISKQTDARINTERGANADDLERQQKQVADGTQKLVEKIDRQDADKKTEKQKAGGATSEDKSKPNDKDEPRDGDVDPKDAHQKDPSGKGDKAPSKSKNTPKSGGEKKPGEPKKGDGSDQQDKKNESEKDKNQDGDKDKPSGDNEKPDKPESDADKPKDSNPGESKPGELKEKSPSKQNGKPKPGKPQKGQKGEPQEDQPQEQPQDNPSENQDQNNPDEKDDAKKSDKTPGRDEVEKARKEMDRAIEELKKKRANKASDKQDQALAELLKAKEKLEEILRQLREEERGMVLAALEARLRDMLQRQETVNIGTLGIHAIPNDKRTDRHRNRSVELARNEDEISLLAAKALTLLKEEGSSVAFPEALEQIREDMLTIARRLERADVGEFTQNVEQDVVESLKEILEALQREIEKMKDQKQQQQQQQQQQERTPSPLVNKLAELKMLRSLQYRVNRRTKQMGRLVDGEQALDADVVNQLRQLSDRQSKVQRATHDLATGRNE